MFGAKEGPRRTSKLASLLTQLLGKVAEAMLMHAKACNLPVFTCGLCSVYLLVPGGADTLDAKWCAAIYLHEQLSMMTSTL